MARIRSIVVFGAGAIGKGLIGLQFSQAGSRITFVDIKDDLVHRLRDAGRYRVLLHRLDGTRKEEAVEGFCVLRAADRDAVAREMVAADLVMTAVFPQNLPDVAQTIALGVDRCRLAGRREPLNCIACENMKNGSATLAGCVAGRMAADSRRYAVEIVGFPNCMVNRVVPNARDPLYVETEDYCEWTLDANAVKGEWPEGIDFLERVTNQAARLERKLYVYNGSHAACAYFGFLRGHAWIHEAIADPEVVRQVGGTLDELAEVTRRHHGFSMDSMENYKRDFWLRCRNPGLKDEVVRIARQPKRKLARWDRLIAPAKLALQYGLPRRHIVEAIAAALSFRHPDDEQSLELGRELEKNGIRATLSEVSELDATDPLAAEIEACCRRGVALRM